MVLVIALLMVVGTWYFLYPIWYRRTLRKRTEQHRLKVVKFFNID